VAILCANRSMRPFGTSKQLAGRRERVLGLLRRGQRPSEVAKQVGATRQTVNRWRRESRSSKRKSKSQHRRAGRPSRLSAAAQWRLTTALKRGAYANGYAEDYWTLDRVAHLIWEMFGIRYRVSGVWYVLQRLGWSCQKPQRRSYARDAQAIAHWKRYIWPHIKKVA
jgi:transposase